MDIAVADVRFLLLLSVLAFSLALLLRWRTTVRSLAADASFWFFAEAFAFDGVCCVDDDRGLGDDCSFCVCFGFGFCVCFCEDDGCDDFPFLWPAAREIFFHNVAMV